MAQDNPLKKKLAAGQAVLGIWSLLPSPQVSEVMASAGLDFLILDMEHGLFDAASVEHCVRACEASGASPLVRIPGLNASAAQWALDSGAHGIVVPQIAGAEEAKTAVAITKYPPQGSRGYNPFVRAGAYGNAKATKLDNQFPLSSVIVETQRSVDELDRICAIDGLDMIYIGVYDLSFALGCNGDVSHKRIRDIVTSSVGKIRKSGKAAGLMVKSQEDIKEALALGANVLMYGVDTQLLSGAVQGAVAAFGATRK